MDANDDQWRKKKSKKKTCLRMQQPKVAGGIMIVCLRPKAGLEKLGFEKLERGGGFAFVLFSFFFVFLFFCFFFEKLGCQLKP